MCKKSKHRQPITQPRPVKIADRAGDELAAFPADQHVLTPKQREVPSPAPAIANAVSLSQISERQRLRAATVSQEQREARARRETLALLDRQDARRDALAHSGTTTVREDLQAVRRRPWDAPMATRIGALADPMAVLAWDAVVEDAAATARSWWDKWGFSAALAVWSAACFLMGRLA